MAMMTVQRRVTGVLMREGAGVKLHRYIGADRLNDLDPLLLLDVFDSDDPMDYIAGFPAHPHRGFETITYLLSGKIAHEDNHGHHGVINSGDVQWMTAGRGIIHSEMPQQTKGRLWGMQLWLNLPAKHKWTPPRYQEYKASQLPVEDLGNGVLVSVIAGTTSNNTTSPINGVVTDPLFFDITLPAGQRFSHPVPKTHQCVLLVLSGSVNVGENDSAVIQEGVLATLSNDDALVIEGLAAENRCIFIAAKKINEPVERLGPFVMNTREEVLQAIEDFRNNVF